MPVALGVNGGVLGSNNLPTATTFRGIFTPNEVARAIALGFWPVNKSQSVTGVAGVGALGTLTIGSNADPYFNLTTLLLSTTATNGQQNNTFQDSSTNNFTITRNPATGPNAPTQGTFSPFSQTGWSNYFDGTGDYLVAPSTTNAAFAWGTGDYSIECWVYPIAAAYTRVFTSSVTANGSCDISSAGAVNYFDGTAYTIGTLSINQWTHLCITRKSGTLRTFKNGVMQYNGANSVNASSNANFGIAATAAGAQTGNLYIASVRMVKGGIPTAYDTSSTTNGTQIFTPPTSAFTGSESLTAGSVSLITCQSNRFIDNSSNNFTITRNGDTSVVPFSPFLPTSAWSASTVGGSGYFDGTGDYLNTPATGQFAPTGNFSIRLWFYLTSLAATNHVIGNYTTNAATDWLVEVINTGVLQVFTNGSTLRLSHSGITTNQWYYLTLTRSGTTITGQINGSNFNVTATYTQSGTFGSATKSIYIGQRAGSTNPLFGYLSSVSLVDGSALQTVPTAPLTNETGTQLLLNFTNSGIYDATAKNVLETVGDAQASTAITPKWGTTSMKFDGTGDYAVSPASPLNAFLTGDFTCEFWIYFNALATNQTVMGTASGFQAGGYQWIQLASNTLTFRMELTTGAINVATGTLSTGQWYHMAATRSGTTVRVFVNGVLANSTTTGGSISDSTGNKVVIGNTVELQATRFFNGYLQDVRVTRGYARYTANFTPPTAAFPVQ